jgi:hypothetical protein
MTDQDDFRAAADDDDEPFPLGDDSTPKPDIDDECALDSETEAWLTEEAKAIRALERRNGRMWALEKRNGFKIGERLIRVKARVGHRRFMPWVRDEFEFGMKTAENYMNMFKIFGDKIETVTNLPITITALYLLAGRNVPAAAIGMALSLAAAGHAVNRTLAIEIVNQCWRQANRDRRRRPRRPDSRRDKLKPSPDDIVTRLAAMHEGLSRLIKKAKYEIEMFGPAGIDHRIFSRNARRLLIRLIVADFWDDDENFALLLEMIERCRVSREAGEETPRDLIEALNGWGKDGEGRFWVEEAGSEPSPL